LVVLDSWALLAYLKDEPGAGQIEEVWLSEGAAVSSVNLGEALYMRIRERGEKAASDDIEKIRKRSKVIGPDWALVRSAARVKAGGGLSYADAFCVATALRLKAPLWTGDPEIVELAQSLQCEVVDLRVSDG
jgi:PIN domain nuclease of toxin-antitoxin system